MKTIHNERWKGKYAVSYGGFFSSRFDTFLEAEALVSKERAVGYHPNAEVVFFEDQRPKFDKAKVDAFVSDYLKLCERHGLCIAEYAGLLGVAPTMFMQSGYECLEDYFQ